MSSFLLLLLQLFFVHCAGIYVGQKVSILVFTVLYLIVCVRLGGVQFCLYTQKLPAKHRRRRRRHSR